MAGEQNFDYVLEDLYSCLFCYDSIKWAEEVRKQVEEA